MVRNRDIIKQGISGNFRNVKNPKIQQCTLCMCIVRTRWGHVPIFHRGEKIGTLLIDRYIEGGDNGGQETYDLILSENERENGYAKFGWRSGYTQTDLSEMVVLGCRDADYSFVALVIYRIPAVREKERTAAGCRADSFAETYA